jgi:hypothetical protein
MTNYLRKMLTDAEAAGLHFTVSSDGDIDYQGFHAAAAEEAVVACDTMDVTLRVAAGQRPVGWAMIVNGLEPDEVIADTSGAWMNDWWDRNIR